MSIKKIREMFNQDIKNGVRNEKKAKKKQKKLSAYIYYSSFLYIRNSCIFCRKEDICGDVGLGNQQSK